MVEFNEVDALKGLVRVLQPLLDTHLGRLYYQDTAGDWQLSTQPAIYLSHPDTQTPDYPLLTITYNGDTNISPTEWESGYGEVEYPEGSGTFVTVPYIQTYLRYIVTLTCDSGFNQDVLEGKRLSASHILRKLRDRLHFDSVRDTIHTEMNSTVTTISTVTPTYDLTDTSYHNSSIMALTFDAISTVYDYSGGQFDTIVVESELYRNEEDEDPLAAVQTVGPVHAS